MEDNLFSIIDEDAASLAKVDDLKLDAYDTFTCTSCPYPIEILKIDDKNNILIFKCLNPKEKKILKTIPINEYLNLMKKNSYLFSECSLCNKKQNEFKHNPVFSYCIKCNVIICSDCINKHLKINKKNHPDLNTEFIIKNNKKYINCLLHPKEKNLAFCFNCNTHICKECMKSKKHINHTKNNIMEVSLTNEMINILNGIIEVYKERIIQLNKEKQNEKTKIKLFDAKEKIKGIKTKKIKDKIKEIQKELLENEKLLSENLYKLKLKYENEVKLCKSKYKTVKDNIYKKYERLNVSYNATFNEFDDNLKIEYRNNNAGNLEYNKKINIADDLLLINQLIKNVEENYPDNYYNNNNINNIIFNYYESKDKSIKEILSKELYNELSNKEKEKQLKIIKY